MANDPQDRIEPMLVSRAPQPMAPQRLHVEFPSRQEVVVVDIRIPFGSMITLMVKWAIASIPAFLILLILGALVVGVLGALVGK